jgi:hypothetical protein
MELQMQGTYGSGFGRKLLGGMGAGYEPVIHRSVREAKGRVRASC